MIVINLSVTVLISPEHLQHQLSEERAYQELQAIYDRQRAEQRAAIEQVQRTTHTATCPCGWSSGGYATAGRARMGLSGHKKSCRRVYGAKT